MKKIILLVCLQMSFLVILAQYSLQPMLPTKGMLQKSGLWNILVMNNSQNSITGRLELILRNRSTGMEVITATSNQISIEKGAKQLNSTLLAPIQYNFLNEGFIKQNQDLIPIGNYTACYRFTSPTEKNITLIEECVQFDVEPLSPPMLATPVNNVELAIQPTQFSWSPPTPIGLFNQLKYDVVIVEVLPEQKPEEAIQQNVPIYTENNTPNNFINYKGSKLNFQKDKLYAWQVVAKDNSEYAAKSEVWCFKIGEEKKSIKTDEKVYVLLNYNKASNHIVLDKKELYIKYYATSNAASTKISVIDNEGKIVQEEVKPTVFGDNYISIKLSSIIKKAVQYSVQITDKDGKIFTSNFSIVK